jgi:hypothetical protein
MLIESSGIKLEVGKLVAYIIMCEEKKMTKQFDNTEFSQDTEQVFSILPIDCDKTSAEKRNVLLDLQLKMATSSINHEYARLEFEDIDCSQRKEELLDYMSECRAEYFKAREDLEKYDPFAVIEFEKDLMHQKKAALSQYHA